ncbi:MAG: hypothetical protein IJ605_02210 [Prevotella sp.]|nr:hypothetical protein [Prevotella sp.]
MKQKLMVFAMMLMLGTMVADAQPKHRHHAVADSTAVAANAAPDEEEIAAYSDTTNVAWDEAEDEEDAMTRRVWIDEDFGTGVPWLDKLMGTWGIAMAIVVVLFVFVMLLAPFILIIIGLRLMIRRHNDRVRLAEKAMETGQQIPEELMPVDKQSDEFLRRRGIRNIWIGIGMAMMFGVWGADMLTGIGLLVLCYGIGQLLIARSSKPKNNENSL